MKKICWMALVAVCLFAGCQGLRFAPNEAQKQNAWLHNRTAAVAAETARGEEVSEQLQGLTELGYLQSGAITAYFGPPKEIPQAFTAEEILEQSTWDLAEAAKAEGAERPDAFRIADNVLELAIGISSLLGGVYGTRAVRFLKEAKDKSRALEEIIAGNELFKKEHKAYAPAFKEAQKNQSPATKQIVAQMKA